MPAAEYKSDFEITKGTPYLALTDELWSVFCEVFGENWSRHNGTTLYVPFSLISYMSALFQVVTWCQLCNKYTITWIKFEHIYDIIRNHNIRWVNARKT